MSPCGIILKISGRGLKYQCSKYIQWQNLPCVWNVKCLGWKGIYFQADPCQRSFHAFPNSHGGSLPLFLWNQPVRGLKTKSYPHFSILTASSFQLVYLFLAGTGSALRGGGIPVQQADQLVLQLHARWQAGEAAGRVWGLAAFCR